MRSLPGILPGIVLLPPMSASANASGASLRDLIKPNAAAATTASAGALSEEQVIGGLFLKIADQERQIRRNPVARTSELLKNVFGSTGK